MISALAALSATFRVTYIFAAMLIFVSSESAAEVGSAAETKARIIAEVAGKQWTGKGYANTAYTSDRFYVESLGQFFDEYRDPNQDLIHALTDGNFEVILPTEAGGALDHLPQYLAAKNTCSLLPFSFWNGRREITQSEYEQRIYDSVAPYVPIAPDLLTTNYSTRVISGHTPQQRTI